MAWTREHRAYFFGCTCVGCRTDDERDLSAAAADEDNAFIERYCAPTRPGEPDKSSVPGTAERLGAVPIAKARCAIGWIAELVPHGDHASPGWSFPKEVRPLISVGGMDGGGAIQKPRFGLVARHGHLYFWCDETSIEELLGNPPDNNWCKLHRAVKYYKLPVDCTCRAADPDRASASECCRVDRAHPFVVGPVRDILTKVEGQLAEARHSKKGLKARRGLATSLRPLRPMLGEPCSGVDEDGNYEDGSWDVIYPKLARAFIDAKDSPGYKVLANNVRPFVDAPQSVSELMGDDASPITDSAALSNAGTDTARQDIKGAGDESERGASNFHDADKHWFGIVSLDVHGVARAESLHWNQVQTKWQAGYYNSADIIFMVSGNKIGVDAIIEDITTLHASLGGSVPAHVPPNGVHYTYVYHETAVWRDVFYVGKGIGNRWRDHLDKVYGNISRQRPILGASVANSSKEKCVERYLRGGTLKGYVGCAALIERLYREALQQPPIHSNPRLMRIVSEFSSHSGIYGDERSQAAEKFLINFHYGVYDLTNDPAGNDTAAFGFLIRPAWYSHRPGEAGRWHQACSYMVANGRLSPLEKTKLDLPYAFPFVSAVDTALARHGVVPVSGRGGLFGHFKAEGAGDFLLRYDVHGRAYGINIRIRRSVPEATMGICRRTFTPAAFEQYIKMHADADVINRGPNAHFRPFRLCGALDDKNVVFGVDTRPHRPGLTAVRVEPNGTVRRGMVGCKKLDIAEAVQQILIRFP